MVGPLGLCSASTKVPNSFSLPIVGPLIMELCSLLASFCPPSHCSTRPSGEKPGLREGGSYFLSALSSRLGRWAVGSTDSMCVTLQVWSGVCGAIAGVLGEMRAEAGVNCFQRGSLTTEHTLDPSEGLMPAAGQKGVPRAALCEG